MREAEGKKIEFMRSTWPFILPLEMYSDADTHNLLVLMLNQIVPSSS